MNYDLLLKQAELFMLASNKEQLELEIVDVADDAESAARENAWTFSNDNSPTWCKAIMDSLYTVLLDAMSPKYSGLINGHVISRDVAIAAYNIIAPKYGYSKIDSL